MPNFGSRWKVIGCESLGRGGQGKAYLVSDSEDPTGPKRAAKVLNGALLTDQSSRWKRLEEEIEISKSFNHPNVIRVIDSGHTQGSGYPFFVMPFYSGGSLQSKERPQNPSAIFNLFSDICDGVVHIHSKEVVHRDLKPANIFLDGSRAIVGDLGLCFRLNTESLTEPMEVATARWFGAPELRNGHLEQPLPCADIYSLGKLLYWLFTSRVYDRDEQEYGNDDRQLSYILSQRGIVPETGEIDDRLIHAGAFADEIVSLTVRYLPNDRIQTARELVSKVRQMIGRFESGGRALNLDLPQRCLFCGNGQYRPIAVPPDVEIRSGPPDHSVLGSHRPSKWAEMRSQTTNAIGQAFAGSGGDQPVPLNLICDYCGNMQQFRWDRVAEAQKRWKP